MIQKVFAFAAQWWRFGVAVLAAVLLSYQLGSCSGYRQGKQAMEKALADANVRFLQQKARADEAAAAQRLADQRLTETLERNLRDAIRNTPDSAPDATRVALGCQRLRAAGTDTSRIPACNGSAR
jgi:hypothetical protein